MPTEQAQASQLRPGDRFLRRPEVERKVGMKSSAIYHGMQKGEFPKCVRIAPRCVVWLESEVEQWMCERYAAARQAA